MITSPKLLFPLADLNLARRLEKAEALSNVDFVEARKKVFPDSGAKWLSVAGAYAMFDGVSSPLTQTFGLGLVQPVTAAEMGSSRNFSWSVAPKCFMKFPRSQILRCSPCLMSGAINRSNSLA